MKARSLALAGSIHKVKVQSFGMVLLLLAISFITVPASSALEKWSGVDETVVEKFAKEHGRAAREPLIHTEGDLLLFLFLIAGAVGGFVAGYYWRMLVAERALKLKEREPNRRG